MRKKTLLAISASMVLSCFAFGNDVIETQTPGGIKIKLQKPLAYEKEKSGTLVRKSFPTGIRYLNMKMPVWGGFKTNILNRKFKFNHLGEVIVFSAKTKAKFVMSGNQVSGDQNGVKDGHILYHSYGSLASIFAVQYGALSAELKLNFERRINHQLAKYFKRNGDQRTTGLSPIPAKTLLEKAYVTWQAFTISQKGRDADFLAFTILVGRDEATPIASFVLPYQAHLTLLDSDRIDQVDQIKVRAAYLQNTIFEFVAYGFNWFGFPDDESRFSHYKQDGKGSFAVNLKHRFNQLGGCSKSKLEVYFSFAHNVGGFLNVNRPVGVPGRVGTIYQNRQRGQHETLAAGAKYTYGKWTVIAEGVAQLVKNGANEHTILVSASYQVTQNVTAYLTFAVQDRSYSEDGSTISGGIAWKLIPNLTGIVQVDGVIPNHGKNYSALSVGLLLDAWMYRIPDDQLFQEP